uniref:Uncharacterized protein n=1 Tax=Octopus bimaculoides TaxID=37653 RepID=A0A0L8HZX2_OCTBM
MNCTYCLQHCSCSRQRHLEPVHSNNHKSRFYSSFTAVLKAKRHECQVCN